MFNTSNRSQLIPFMRVVALPGDRLTVHLVAEVSRFGTPEATPDFRSQVTVCGRPGYEATTRALSACPECVRGMSDTAKSAIVQCRIKLGLIERVGGHN